MTEAQTQRTRESANAPFLRNAWYVGAWSEELANGPFARTIMNEPIAFFRDATGKVNAIEDRCCHRGAALTDGKVVENGLQCGYHGLVFDGTGACVEIPGQDTVPPMARVKGYPVVERQEFVWIWMGDPALADEGKIIDWPFHDDANQHPHRKAVLHIKANYLMMIDNLMDLTHLGYVHSKTIGGNPLSHRRRGLMGRESGRRVLSALEAMRGGDGTIPLSFEIVYGHAFKPEPTVNAQGEAIVRFLSRR